MTASQRYRACREYNARHDADPRRMAVVAAKYGSDVAAIATDASLCEGVSSDDMWAWARCAAHYGLEVLGR